MGLGFHTLNYFSSRSQLLLCMSGLGSERERRCGIVRGVHTHRLSFAASFRSFCVAHIKSMENIKQEAENDEHVGRSV